MKGRGGSGEDLSRNGILFGFVEFAYCLVHVHQSDFSFKKYKACIYANSSIKRLNSEYKIENH